MATLRRGNGVAGSAGSPPLRSPGAAASASRPHRRAPGGDLPPDRLSRGPRPRLLRLRLLPPTHRRPPLPPPLPLRPPPSSPPRVRPPRRLRARPAAAPLRSRRSRSRRRCRLLLRAPPPAGRWPRGWHPRDARDGLVLLECSPGPVERYARRRGVFFPDLAACDPLSRRYVLLAPIPDGLVASAQMQERNLKGFEAFLAPCGDEEATLRVIGRALDASKLVVFVFSSTSGQWSIGASTSWDALELTLPPPPPPGDYMLQRGHYCAYGCFFWKLNRNNKLLMLDLSKMKFSTVDLPTDHVEEHVVIVEAGEGRLGMLSGMDSGRGGPVYYFIRQNKGHGVQEWQMENIVEIMGQLSMVCDYSTIGTIEGFVLLYCLQKSLAPAPSIQYFSLDVRTMNLERVSRDHRTYCISPYVGFHPFVSPRRI